MGARPGSEGGLVQSLAPYRGPELVEVESRWGREQGKGQGRAGSREGPRRPAGDGMGGLWRRGCLAGVRLSGPQQ